MSHTASGEIWQYERSALVSSQEVRHLIAERRMTVKHGLGFWFARLSALASVAVLAVGTAVAENPASSTATISPDQLERIWQAVALPLDKSPSESRVWKGDHLTKVSSLSFLLVTGASEKGLDNLKKMIEKNPQLCREPENLLGSMREPRAKSLRGLTSTGDFAVIGVGSTTCAGTCTKNCGVLGCDAHKLSDGSIYCTPCNCVQDAGSPACGDCSCTKTNVFTENGVIYRELPEDWSFTAPPK